MPYLILIWHMNTVTQILLKSYYLTPSIPRKYTYLKLNNQKKALKYYNKSYTIRKQLNYSPLLALSYNSFGRLEELKKTIKKQKCIIRNH